MSNKLLFIDPQVTNYEALLASLGNDVEVHLLNAEDDGILQIERLLKGRTELEDIHILSHGSSGALFLGSSVLTSDNLNRYADELSRIGCSLSEHGDILLYGCNIASDDAGLNFIDSLAGYTGADVAASDDLTGNTIKGGDWILEAQTGVIDSEVVFSEEGQNSYEHTLNVTLYGTTDSEFAAFSKADITLPNQYTHWFGTVKYNHLFILHVPETYYINFGLSNLTKDVDLQLWTFNSSHRNFGNMLKQSVNDGTANESIIYQNLPAGDYIVNLASNDESWFSFFLNSHPSVINDYEAKSLQWGGPNGGLTFTYNISGNVPIGSNVPLKLFWADSSGHALQYIDISSYLSNVTKGFNYLYIPGITFKNLVAPSGAFYIGIKFDENNTVAETNEQNNLKVIADVSISDNVRGNFTPYTESIVKNLLRQSGEDNAVLESFERTSADQARIMFNNLTNIGSQPGQYASLDIAIQKEKLLYLGEGQKVINVFIAKTTNFNLDQIKSHSKEIQEAMKEQIDKVPYYVSHHVVPFNSPTGTQVFDLAPSSFSTNSKQLFHNLGEDAKINKTFSKFLDPWNSQDRAFHIEITQPNPQSVPLGGTSTVSNSYDSFKIQPGNYSATIAGFRAGNKIILPVAHDATVQNTSTTDGKVDLLISVATAPSLSALSKTTTLSAAPGGSLVTLHLTGLTLAQDQALTSIAAFDTVFGKETIIKDDYDNTTATTAKVLVDGTGTTGSLESAGDEDWFSVKLTAGETYAFRAKNGFTALPITIYDATGNLSSLDTSFFTAPATGTYYLGVADYEAHTGAYTVTARHLAGFVTGGVGLNNEILNGAQGFSFSLSADSDLQLSLFGLDELMLVRVLTLYDDGGFSTQGGLVTWKEFISTNDSFDFSAENLPGGQWYYVQVLPLGQTSGLYSFTGTASNPGFNIDYAITSLHDPYFIGSPLRSYPENHAFIFSYGALFNDEDIVNGDALTFSINSDQPLPSWMVIDTQAQLIQGTPPRGAEDVHFHITATDKKGASVTEDILFLTPSPDDSAGNSVTDAVYLDSLNHYFFRDYLGEGEDEHDYYQFSTVTNGSLSINFGQLDGTGMRLTANLLTETGSLIATYHQSGLYEYTDLPSGHYYLQMSVNEGAGDYGISIYNDYDDRGGNLDNPSDVALLAGKHTYLLSDYISYNDPVDSYQINLNEKAWVGSALELYNPEYDSYLYQYDWGHGYVNGYYGAVFVNGQEKVPVDNTLYYDSATNDYVNSYGYLRGSVLVNLQPATWTVEESIWVDDEFGGHYEDQIYDQTFDGVANAQITIDRKPKLVNPIQNQVVNIAKPFEFSVANPFQDSDGDTIQSITATLANGSALPAWIAFDPSTMTFSGRVTNIATPITVLLTATFNGPAPDSSFRTVKDKFSISPKLVDIVGNTSASSQTLNLGSASTVVSISSSDGNDYFALSLDHTTPVGIKLDNISTTATATLLSNDGTVLQTVTANSEGLLQFATSSLTKGTYYLHLETAANPGGYLLQVDDNYNPNTAIPTELQLATDTDSGLSSNDAITNITDPVLIGSAASGNTVLIFDGTIQLGKTLADAQGNWRFNLPILSEGLHNITAQAEDFIGTRSNASTELNLTIDTVSPTKFAESILALTEAFDSNAMKIQVPTLAGVSDEPLTSISIYDNGLLIGTTNADTNGIWYFVIPTLPTGEHSLSATISDLAGNISEESLLVITNLDKTTQRVISSTQQIFLGNDDFNTLSFSAATAPVTVNLDSSLFQETGFGSKQLIGIEGIVGSDFNDKLLGNAGVNILNGGLGADTMKGGLGNDVYYVDNIGDIVFETANLTSEIDQVKSTITYRLKAGVENLTLIGATAINGTGNALDNILTGNVANNILSGGAGADILIGGLGADTFKFKAETETGVTATTIDIIVDFKRVQGDKIDLSEIDANIDLEENNAFSELEVGGVFSGAFTNPGSLYFDKIAHVLYGNNDADSVPDFSIQLNGVGKLVATDFVF